MRSSSAVEVIADPAHSRSISVKLRDINQLFNSMDPSPFIEKDLDDKAEEFIVGWRASSRLTHRSSCGFISSSGRPKTTQRN